MTERKDSITEALDGTSKDLLRAMRLVLAGKLDAGVIAGNSIAAAYKELRELDRVVRESDDLSVVSDTPARGRRELRDRRPARRNLSRRMLRQRMPCRRGQCSRERC